MAAVEQNQVKGVGHHPWRHAGWWWWAIRFFSTISIIDGGANRDFAGYAVNWLLDRPTLLKGIGPRPVAEFRLMMTRQQQRRGPLAVAGRVARRAC